MRGAVIGLILSIAGMTLSLIALMMPSAPEKKFVCSEAQFKRAMEEAKAEYAFTSGSMPSPDKLLAQAKARICEVAK